MFDGGGGGVAAGPQGLEAMTESGSEGCATGLKMLGAMVIFGMMVFDMFEVVCDIVEM